MCTHTPTHLLTHSLTLTLTHACTHTPTHPQVQVPHNSEIPVTLKGNGKLLSKHEKYHKYKVIKTNRETIRDLIKLRSIRV